MKIIKTITLLAILLSPLMSCSSNNQPKESESVDYGELIIKDIDVWFENDYDTLDITFTKPEYASEIAYSFRSNIIAFRGNEVIQANKSVRVIEVKATTQYHETTFNVNTHYEPSHSYDIPYFEEDRNERGIKDGQIIFVGDSFFDPRGNLWHNFYNDVSSENYQVFASGSGGSKIEEWRGMAQKLIYNCKPKHILVNCASNDFWDGGALTEDVANHFNLLMKDIHKHLPDSIVYYYTMLNRKTPLLNKDAEQTSQVVKTYNQLVKDYAKDMSWVKICDVYQHFTNEDGSAKTELLKDGCHPKDDEYKEYVELAIDAGAPLVWRNSREQDN